MTSTTRDPRRARFASLLLAVAATAIPLCGCSSTPPLTRTGFLSSYDSLQKVSDHKMNYVSPSLTGYRSFIIDPVEIRSQPGELKPEERAEIASYFREALSKELRERGYAITTSPGADTARVRLALTNIQESTWWKKIHPASSLAGAGRGGASMEGEIIDAVTGDQLAAVVQAGTGSQFTAFNYSTMSDLRSTIDQWADHAGNRLDELRKTGK